MIYSFGALDYETAASHQLKVIAHDLGDPSLTSTTEVRVNVIDLEDERPQFEKRLYELSLQRDAQAGEVLATVSAGSSSYKYTIVSK